MAFESHGQIYKCISESIIAVFSPVIIDGFKKIIDSNIRNQKTTTIIK
jgi:hypothetical protein